MKILEFLLAREAMIAFAICGAVIATIGSYLQRENSKTNPKTARFVTRTGYAISWVSVAIFIAAGFLSGW